MNKPTKEEIEFSYAVSVLIASDVLKQYAEGLTTMCTDNYKRNKMESTVKLCTQNINMLHRDLGKIMPHLQPYIEARMDILYNVVGMDADDQKRVLGLIKKIKGGK